VLSGAKETRTEAGEDAGDVEEEEENAAGASDE
jgi:hypothetical protein